MIDFFKGSSKPKGATTTTTSASASSSSSQKKKPKSSVVTVTTTRKVVPKPAHSSNASSSIAAISGYRPINALSEEKRRKILEDRLAAEASSSKSSRATSAEAPPKKRRRKRPAALSSDEEEENIRGGKKSARGSTAPSTPRGSKRQSVDPHTADSYQKLGREGVAPSYVVSRDVLAESDAAPCSCIQSSQVVAANMKAFGPFFNGLGDSPRATLEYPAKGQSEEYLLLAPKDNDEYDPLLELLSAVRTIVANYLTPEQQEAFGSLDSLQISSNAGMIQVGSSVLSAEAKLNGVRAKSADLLESGLQTPRDDSPAPAHTAAKTAISGLTSMPDSPLSSQSSSTAAASSDPDSILRSFTKARNRRDGPLFLRTLSRFNAELSRLKASGAIEQNIAELSRVPEPIWRLIQDQVYARTVGPRVEELGRYQAFSDNVYGELLPRFMSEIAQLTSLGPAKVFVDLGSGVGNLLIQTSLQTGCEAYGCEMMPVPAGLAVKQIEEAQQRWRAWGLKGGPRTEAWEGDFGEHEKVREILRRADVVLVNNYAFLPKTNDNLSLLFLDLPDGASVVSLKPFVPPDFRLTERTLSSPLAILRVAERQYTSGCVSWADGGGKYYIQTVDRSLVREFLERGGEPGGVGRKRWKARIEEDDDDDE